MIDRIVLAMRTSPDWGLLARDYAAGIPVPPSRYFPFHDLRFSRDIPGFIERWNEFSPVSYFACRKQLRDIADDNLAQIRGVTLTPWARVPDLLDELGDARLLLFYHDDDDWFHPAVMDLLRGIDVDSIDAAVFPFLRLASSVTTFTRGGSATSGSIGNLEPFRYRYCTNNYGLTRRAFTHRVDLVEHTVASSAADSLKFADLHVDRIISATSKTPCSASWLLKLPADRSAFMGYIAEYIAVLEQVEIPAESCWIETWLRKTLDVFRAVTRD